MKKNNKKEKNNILNSLNIKNNFLKSLENKLIKKATETIKENIKEKGLIIVKEVEKIIKNSFEEIMLKLIEISFLIVSIIFILIGLSSYLDNKLNMTLGTSKIIIGFLIILIIIIKNLLFRKK